MKISPVLLLLAVVLSGAGRASAQQEPPPTDAPRQEVPSPPLVPAHEGLAPAPEPAASPQGELLPREDARGAPLSFWPRTGVGLLGGIGGGLVGAGLGATAGQVASTPVGCEEEVCSGARLSGAYVGALLAVPAGTYFASELVGGRGSYTSALAGSMVGWGTVAIAQFLALDGEGLGEAELEDAPVVALLMTLPALGSTLGYQISHANYPPTPRRPGTWPVVRVLLEVLVGSVGGAAAGLGGSIGGFGAATSCSFTEPCSSTGDELIINVITISSGMVGSVLGVYGAGTWMRGRGSILPTLIGGAFGAVAGGGLLAVTGSDAGVLLALTAPLVGAIIGYEVSNGLAVAADPEPAVVGLRPAAGLEVLPVIAATPAGGLVGGLVGRF